jgi:hypothetical protein
MRVEWVRAVRKGFGAMGARDWGWVYGDEKLGDGGEV